MAASGRTIWARAGAFSPAGNLALVDGDIADPQTATRIAECAVGHTAAEGGLAAVLRARATGAGAVVDCAASEVLAATPNRIAQHLAWEYRNRRDMPAEVADSTSTLLPLGIFPCGDVRIAPVKRVAAAVGEGSMAIAFVHQYLKDSEAARER